MTSVACPRVITRTWQVTDSIHPTVTCSQTVTVVDTTKPTITCPANITVETCVSPVRVFFSAPVATDTCSPSNVSVNCNRESGSYFPAGTTTVTCTATDACGIPSDPCTFTVTVNVRPPIPCVRPPDNMVLWLPFDEPAGSGKKTFNARASTAGVKHPGLILSPTTVPQYVLRGLCFDGVRQYVAVKHYAEIKFDTGDFSLDAWIKRDAGVNGLRRIIDKRDRPRLLTTFRGYSLSLNNGLLQFQLADGSANGTYSSTQPVPGDGQWHHVAVTVQRQSNTGGKFFLDGAGVGVFDPTPVAGPVGNKVPFIVGRSSFKPWSFFLGCIDEVEAFSRVLSPTEVAGIFNARENGKCKVSLDLPPDSGLCANQNAVGVVAKLCNASGDAQTFTYSLSGLPVGGGCTVAGPTMFTPASGTVTVGPGQCVLIPVTIGRPAGMNTLGQIACYQMDVQSTTMPCQHLIRTGRLIDRRDLCGPVIVNNGGGAVVNPGLGWAVAAIDPEILSVLFTNSGGATLSGTLRIAALNDGLLPDTSVLSLNGLPPGTPVTQPLTLTAGASTTVNLV